jgi:hypothetical protein
VAGLGTELGEFVAVGVGLAFGAFGAFGVGTQSARSSSRSRAASAQKLASIFSAPARARLVSAWGGLLCRLRAGGVLLRQLGGLFCRIGQGECLVPVGLGGADLVASLGAACPDRSVPLGFGGADPGGSVLTGRLNQGIPVGFGSGAGRLGLGGACVGGAAIGARGPQVRRIPQGRATLRAIAGP